MPGFLADALTRPRNNAYLIAVNAAKSWGVPPTTFLHEKTNTSRWTKADKKLALAHQILETERCQYCGQYMWICRSSEQRLGFKVYSDTCFADAELNRKENQSGTLKPGEHQYVVPYMQGDLPLPTRAEYFESLKDD